MKEKPRAEMPVFTFRTTPEDRKIIERLRKELGLDMTNVIRLSIRTLAQKEGVA